MTEKELAQILYSLVKVFGNDGLKIFEKLLNVLFG